MSALILFQIITFWASIFPLYYFLNIFHNILTITFTYHTKHIRHNVFLHNLFNNIQQSIIVCYCKAYLPLHWGLWIKLTCDSSSDAPMAVTRSRNPSELCLNWKVLNTRYYAFQIIKKVNWTELNVVCGWKEILSVNL